MATTTTPVEERVARLENAFVRIEVTMAELKTDVRWMRYIMLATFLAFVLDRLGIIPR